jgi:DNA-directed RNA polymerase subunit RPC12/RpoP
MTTIEMVSIICPQCQNKWRETFHPSICTWIDPELVKKLYDEPDQVQCPHCGFRMRVEAKILINCPKGMFLLDVGHNLDNIRHILHRFGIVNEKGEVVNVRPKPSSPTGYI